jgi:multiple sugar transport system ATP-binding protein
VAEITMQGVQKIYPDGTEAVAEIDLNVEDGSLMVLVGPSGCGKTTLLRMVAGLEDITAGTIRIGDRVVNEIAPKDRDIAMVFQNYALYPHMSVFDNMAYGLKLRKTSKKETRRLVESTAAMLGLKDLLDKKPAQLSGGQRQRVAMGRAIVRQPKAFLMDEPLSNLDAKLRVQMRSEISRLQRDVDVTTIYVTHDQTEAMTMGDQVAVMKNGYLQQVDGPQDLYDRPVNLFVAGFIGSPAMNLVEAELIESDGRHEVEFGGLKLKVENDAFARRPSLSGYVGRRLILGIRPEDIWDASLMSSVPEGSTIPVEVDLREAMGSEVYVHFTLDVPPVLTDDTRDLAMDAGEAALEALEDGAQQSKNQFIARFSARTRVQEGQRAEVYVDSRNLHYFDSHSGEGLY